MTRAVRGGDVFRTDGTVANDADGLDAQGRRLVIVNESKAVSGAVITVNEDIEPTAGVVTLIDTDATVLFLDDTVPIPVKLLAGVVYPYSIKKVTVGEGITGLY